MGQAHGRHQGVRGIVLNSQRTDRLAAQAEWLLPLVLDETDFVFKPSASRYAVLLAIDVLATTVALCDAAGNRERLRRTKLALDNWRGGGDERLPLGD